MQKVKKSKKVEEPEQMQEPGKRKRKEVESSKAIAKAGKTSKQSKKKDEEDAAVAAAKKKKSKKPVDSDSDSSDSSDSDSSSSSSSESDSDSDSDPDEQIAPETPKASTDDAQEASDGDASVDENHVSNFNLSKEVCAQLETKGITSLYSIQAQCFQPILDGKDLVGRARTGCGKTLAFVLPIVEVINRENPMPANGRRVQGRRPVVALLAPTRELAKQVHTDFQHIGKALGLVSICVYGGAPYGDQERALRQGCDIVIGTPGRVKDHLDRKTLSFEKLRFRVLDEADEMLNMGFVEDIETILNHAKDNANLQTVLFSATLPKWVADISSRFLTPGYTTIDLVGNEKQKASSSVQHRLINCQWSERTDLVCDLIRATVPGDGRVIVFCDTKSDCDELVNSEAIQFEARPLHGDVAQATREKTMEAFRNGRFRVLVATDVAARGLDMRVDLVIQTKPPVGRFSAKPEVETYVHRSGRTGRAGRKGVCVTLYSTRDRGMLQQIEPPPEPGPKP